MKPEHQKAIASVMKRLIREGYVSPDEWPVLQKKWFKDLNKLVCFFALWRTYGAKSYCFFSLKTFSHLCCRICVDQESLNAAEDELTRFKQVEADACYSQRIAQWQGEAAAGHATSAHVPVTPTVGNRLMNFAEEVLTPDNVSLPQPLSKKQLTAAKRLEKELCAKGSTMPKAEGMPAGDSSKPKSKKQTKAPKVTKATKDEPKKRKSSAGPMQVAMRAFIKQKMSEGLGYKEALSKWGESAERKSIVDSVSDSEKKRRRY